MSAVQETYVTGVSNSMTGSATFNDSARCDQTMQ